MKMHNLLRCILILYVTGMKASSPRELTLIETSSSKIEQGTHKRSQSTSDMYSRLSCYPTPRGQNYNYDDIDTILMQHNPSSSCFFQNSNNFDTYHQSQNENSNSYYAVNIPDERRQKTAKFSKKTVVAFTLLTCLNLCKLVTDILELEKYYDRAHANNDKPGTLYASLSIDITSLLLFGAVYKCNHNKF